MSLLDSVLLRALPHADWADRILHRRGFRRALGRDPSLDGGMNDAIFFLMTGPEAHNPMRATVADKEYVKSYVRSRIGDQYNVPTIDLLARWQTVKDYHRWPENCVVKPTHLSARVMFTPPHGKLDMVEIEDWFNTNYYWWNREPWYKTLERKVIIEPLLWGSTNVNDYKIMCVRGEPRMIWVDTDRRIGHKRNFYTCDWKPLAVSLGCPRGNEVPKPEKLDEMLWVASELSQDFNMIRVDLYSNGEEVKVGELTNSSGCGREPFFEGEDIVRDLLFGKESIRPVLEAGWPKSLTIGKRAGTLYPETGKRSAA